MEYIPTIGLEIHAQLNTKTKMFCDSLNDSTEVGANVNVCPICLAHPGTLPVANIEAVKKVVKVGLALNCKINELSWFERKNYFYPDLPKGYQITQFEMPFCEKGYLELPRHKNKKINITRIHLEEDTGRLLHDAPSGKSLVDFNRAGVPLMELVTEPDIESASEAVEFGEEFRLLLRYLNVSGADMEKGQMRLEANISIRPENNKKLGTKVELKNINSFKAMERALKYEIERHKKVLEAGKKIIQETRGWNDGKGETFSQRTKEGSADYRYFPEPDLPPVRLEKAQIDTLRDTMLELPQQRRIRFGQEYGVKEADVQTLTNQKELGEYFEQVVSELKRWVSDGGIEDKESKVIKLATNYLLTELRKLMVENKTDFVDLKITPEDFAELMVMIEKGTVSSSAAQELLRTMLKTGTDPHELVDSMGLTQVSDEGALREAASQVIKENPKAVEDYKKGKEQSLQFMVGQVMRHMKGAANPSVAANVLKKLLD